MSSAGHRAYITVPQVNKIKHDWHSICKLAVTQAGEAAWCFNVALWIQLYFIAMYGGKSGDIYYAGLRDGPPCVKIVVCLANSLIGGIFVCHVSLTWLMIQETMWKRLFPNITNSNGIYKDSNIKATFIFIPLIQKWESFIFKQMFTLFTAIFDSAAINSISISVMIFVAHFWNTTAFHNVCFSNRYLQKLDC